MVGSGLPPPPLCSHSPSPRTSVPSSLINAIPSSQPPVPLPSPQRGAWIANNPKASRTSTLPSSSRIHPINQDAAGRGRERTHQGPGGAAQGAALLRGHQRAHAPSQSQSHDGAGSDWPGGGQQRMWGGGGGRSFTAVIPQNATSPPDADSSSVRQEPPMQPLDLHAGPAPRLGLRLTVCAPPPGC